MIWFYCWCNRTSNIRQFHEGINRDLNKNNLWTLWPSYFSPRKPSITSTMKRNIKFVQRINRRPTISDSEGFLVYYISEEDVTNSCKNEPNPYGILSLLRVKWHRWEFLPITDCVTLFKFKVVLYNLTTPTIYRSLIKFFTGPDEGGSKRSVTLYLHITSLFLLFFLKDKVSYKRQTTSYTMFSTV